MTAPRQPGCGSMMIRAGGRGKRKARGRKEESSFFEKKEAKKLHPLATGSLAHRVSCEKSFFASFFPKKEDSSCLPLAWLFLDFQMNGVKQNFFSHGVRRLEKLAPNE
jgi:hypothetical protein